jgi:hypothetical protein
VLEHLARTRDGVSVYQNAQHRLPGLQVLPELAQALVRDAGVPQPEQRATGEADQRATDR